MNGRQIIITVYGIPEDYGRKRLKEFTQRVRESVAGIKDLEIGQSEVVVLISRDMVFSGSNSPILFRCECSSTLKGFLDIDWTFDVRKKFVEIARQSFPANEIVGIQS